MNKSTLAGIVVGVTAATAVGAIAGYAVLTEPDTARQAAQRCYEVEVERVAEADDEKRVAGTVIGAIVGGAVGKDLGDRDLTTAAGAAAGAYVGNQAQKKFQENRTEASTQVRCEP